MSDTTPTTETARDATLAEICVAALADAFAGDGEIFASGMGTIPMLGARLARATSEPDLLISDGEAFFVANDLAIGGTDKEIEGWVPFRSVFDTLWGGRRHVIMGASQIDAYGNQNIANIGPWAKPKAQLLGVRGGPGNTINHTTTYFVPKHSDRVFVEKVDTVSGVGYDRAAELGDWVRPITRSVGSSPTWPCSTSPRPIDRMHLVSVHPGVTVDDVVGATGFESRGRRRHAHHPAAHRRRAPHPPRRPRPEGLPGEGTALLMHPALHTPLLDVLGSRYPIVQTGMGWVAGPSLVSATSNAGAFGIIASATMTFDELVRAIAAVKKRTDAPVRRELPRRRRRHQGPPRPHHPRGRPRGLVRPGARRQDLIDHLHDHGVKVMPSIGAKRHAEKVMEWGVDAVLVQGGEGGGHTGAVPTSLLLPEVVDVVDGRVPVVAAGGYFDGRGLVAALAYGASGVAMGTRFLLTSDSSVPVEVKKAYLGTPVNGTLVTTKIDGAPHRVIRTELVDEMDSASPVTAVPKAVANAARFRKYTDLSWLQMAREGLDMKKRMDLSWAEVIMAGNTPMLTKATLVDGELDAGILPTGQVVGVIDDLPSAADLVERIIADAGATLDRLAGAPVVTRSGTDRI